MARIVQKYGGTSVGDVERIRKVAERVKAIRDEGNELVIVVSARAGVTNELIARAKALCTNPSEREMDQLLAIGEQETIALTAMALHGVGAEAVSYTGAQAGIFTDKVHTKAKIKTINAKPIEADLKAGKIVIVAGFQGINEEGQITTLGRGGSDLTAIALADASIIVDMIVQNVGRNGIANLTFTVPLTDSAKAQRTLEPVLDAIGGGQVAIHENIAKLSVVGVGMKTHSGVAATLFQALADAGVNIELISTSEIKISVVIDKTKVDDAARVAHAAFELEKL